VARTLLPDVLTYQPGTVAGYGVAARNGRRLTDDVLDVLLSLFANQPISDLIGPEGQYQPSFPYLAAPISNGAARNV
jgi:hypothetical protein